MPEDLFHPRKQAARAKFYRHTATVKKSAGSASSDDETNFVFEDVLTAKKCLIGQLPGARPGDFENEAPTKDTALFQERWTAITAGMVLVVTLAGVEKWFNVLDVVHIAGETQTLCTLAPR